MFPNSILIFTAKILSRFFGKFQSFSPLLQPIDRILKKHILLFTNDRSDSTIGSHKMSRKANVNKKDVSREVYLVCLIATRLNPVFRAI